MAAEMVYNIQLRFDKGLKSKVLNLARTLECHGIINTTNGYAPNVSVLVTQNYESIEKDLSAMCIPTGSIPVSIDLYKWGDDNALYLTIAASEAFTQFQQRLYDVVMVRNMYGENGFVIEEEFHPLNWKPLCMLANSVPVDMMKDVETLMEKIEWPLVGFLEKVVVVNVSNDIPTHVATFGFVKSAMAGNENN